MKVMSVFGTRPEAIKMCPLVKELEATEGIESIVCLTGQHREMLQQVIDIFGTKVDYNLNIMRQGQTLTTITADILTGIEDILKTVKPDIVLVHGDTSTSFVAALAAFYQQIPVGHVEAGLRTFDKYSPFPEEMNRSLTGRIAELHFAPTQNNLNNLKNEGIESNVFVTGNTVIDALHLVVNKIKSDASLENSLIEYINTLGYDVNRLNGDRRLVLVTGHRRENFGDGFMNICNALKDLSERYPNVDFLYPMHLNPNVRRPINEVFGNISHGNVFFIEPVEYLYFVYLMTRSYIILTDSGGIQEEAPSLGKPVLVMREVTERPEALEAGTIRLVGTNRNLIIEEASKFLDDANYYAENQKIANPYGDGTACRKIVETITNFFKA